MIDPHTRFSELWRSTRCVEFCFSSPPPATNATQATPALHCCLRCVEQNKQRMFAARKLATTLGECSAAPNLASAGGGVAVWAAGRGQSDEDTTAHGSREFSLGGSPAQQPHMPPSSRRGRETRPLRTQYTEGARYFRAGTMNTLLDLETRRSAKAKCGPILRT